jgi:hypothetical protein
MLKKGFLIFAVAGIVHAGAYAAVPFAPAGHSVTHKLADPAEGESAVASFITTAGAAGAWRGREGQWFHLKIVKRDGGTLEYWLLCAAPPAGDYEKDQNLVLRYILRRGDGRPVEYRHGVTGRPVLPSTGAWPWLIPRPFPGAGPAETAHLLGLRYTAGTPDTAAPVPPPEDTRLLLLRPDVLTGVPHNTRQKDETRRYDDSDYEYQPLTGEDYSLMLDAGINCFRADAARAAWCDEAGVFYWGCNAAELAYPDSLYNPLYIGPALFLNEPMVVTRDHALRPRLREDPAFRKSITPQAALEAFQEHYAAVIAEGPPVQLLAQLKRRPDADTGAMNFKQANLYSWETMISSAAYQLLYDPATPGAIIFEPPGQLGTRRTLPDFNMSYGCQIPVRENNFIDIIIALLRGAARAGGKEWGISIYGGVDRADAPGFITRAYHLGATRFFYWDSHRLACVPFGEVMALTRHLSALAEEYPYRDPGRLRQAAETAILFPPGYNLGHVHMGKGILWGLGELNLERTNRHGIPYRTVMGNLFTEIERCLRLGIAFDLLWDLPDLDPRGYCEIVRIREDGKVEISTGREAPVRRDQPRMPPRPEGDAPQLRVEVLNEPAPPPCRVRLRAHVTEGSAPVYYAPAPRPDGIHPNQRAAWELYGPEDETYTCRTPVITIGPVRASGEGRYTAEAALFLQTPGRYRLRAAASDLAGRTAVAWEDLTVPAVRKTREP